MRALLGLTLLVTGAPVAAQPPSTPPAAAGEPARMRADALALEALVDRAYAYPDRLPGGHFALTPVLRREAEAVAGERALLRFVERALMLLADHHAISGASFADSWAIVPSFADLWIEPRGARFVIEAVRAGSPAEAAGIGPGDLLAAVDGVPAGEAVTHFLSEIGTSPGGDRTGFAARILAAGRRDRPRRLTIERAGAGRTHVLPNLYQIERPARPPVRTSREGAALVVHIHDSLGDRATIAAFDAAMRSAAPRQRVVIDLTETPGGGNTIVARAILGWFVDRPRFYQMHSLPAEQRDTGIARQWVEQVLPRPGLRHRGPVEVRVGRWTGSMGEGLAIGFDAIGAEVRGTRMAGLLGAVYDHRLEQSGLIVKIPTERLLTADGHPRESFVPRPLRQPERMPRR